LYLCGGYFCRFEISVSPVSHCRGGSWLGAGDGPPHVGAGRRVHGINRPDGGRSGRPAMGAGTKLLWKHCRLRGLPHADASVIARAVGVTRVAPLVIAAQQAARIDGRTKTVLVFGVQIGNMGDPAVTAGRRCATHQTGAARRSSASSSAGTLVTPMSGSVKSRPGGMSGTVTAASHLPLTETCSTFDQNTFHRGESTGIAVIVEAARTRSAGAAARRPTRVRHFRACPGRNRAARMG
jgi:hypothetical protein